MLCISRKGRHFTKKSFHLQVWLGVSLFRGHFNPILFHFTPLTYFNFTPRKNCIWKNTESKWI